MGRRADDLYQGFVEMMSQMVPAGEELIGVAVANDQGIFSQRTYVIGVTKERLVFQPMSNRWAPSGDAFTVLPGDLDQVSGQRMGEENLGWDLGSVATSLVMSSAGGTIKLKLRDGRKMKLMMIGGDGAIGSALATDDQQTGVVALTAWLSNHRPG
ncbi:MAG TPA: hypothetical protein VK866_12900 [Acidimicrobiales bacterium]|nr:hypothetical protein [Acidimicrobiales bacterium]